MTDKTKSSFLTAEEKSMMVNTVNDIIIRNILIKHDSDNLYDHVYTFKMANKRHRPITWLQMKSQKI